MRTGLWLAAIAALSSVPAAAHEVWVERDGNGPARIYLGEPAEPVPATGDPEFHRLRAPVVLAGGSREAVALNRKADHIEAAVTVPGDVRVRDDAVFDPWDGKQGKQGAIFYARAGRAETHAALDLEIVPVEAHGDTLMVIFRGKPVPDASVNVIAPDRAQRELKSDAQGRISVPALGAGRYILAASHQENGAARIAGKDVASIVHVSTISFTR